MPWKKHSSTAIALDVVACHRAVAVGLVGYVAPNTLGGGYINITGLVSNDMTVAAVAWLCEKKFISWSISLGSGTSGGTLAPLYTLGLLLGATAHAVLPHWRIDLRIASVFTTPRPAELVPESVDFTDARYLTPRRRLTPPIRARIIETNSRKEIQNSRILTVKFYRRFRFRQSMQRHVRCRPILIFCNF